MKLYLVQHGEAVPKERDPDRPLTAQGEADIRRLAALLYRAGVRLNQAYHSGKTRARQSAELLATELLSKGKPRVLPGIEPNDPVTPFVEAVTHWDKDALVVGHLPFLARAASLLLSGDETKVPINLRPGSLVCLEREAGGPWGLAWMLRSELMTFGK